MSNPNLIGVNFDKMRVTPALDSSIYMGLAGSPVIRLWGCDLHWSNLTLSIDPGAMIVQGRYIRIQGQQISTTFPANFTGWFVLTIDLTKSNDSTGNPVYDNYSVENNQIYFRYILDGDRRYEDTSLDGKVFDMSIAYCVTDATKFTTVEMSAGVFFNSPNPADIRVRAAANDRVYEKIALNNVTVGNKYNNCNITLRRHGRICFAKINFKAVTTLAWEQLLDIGNFPGYRPDGWDYGGILNEMSYNTVAGGAYIGGTALRVMHVGRPDVAQTTYSGAITYMTNDDYPNDADIISGFKRI